MGGKKPDGQGIDYAELVRAVLGSSPLSMWTAEASSRVFDALNGRVGDGRLPEESKEVKGAGNGR